MNPRRTVEPTEEPVTLSEIKTHLRISGCDDDLALKQYLKSAREEAENHIDETLMESTWEYRLDEFPDEICLPMGPIQSISSISYVDTDGATQTFSDYQFNREGKLKPAYGEEWPETRDQYDAVTITYVAGESDADRIQDDIKQAIKLMVGSYDISREDIVIGVGTVVTEAPKTAVNLLNRYRKFTP